MFDDKYMMKFAYGLLVVISIVIDGPIVPIISVILAVAFLVYKYKQSKNDPEKGMDFMIDMIIVSIVIIVNIVLAVLRMGVMYNTNKYYKTYSDSSYESMTADEFASLAISEFNTKKVLNDYTYKQTKQEFKNFLEDAVGVVTASGSKISCEFGSQTIVFSVSLDGDITYKVK